MGRNAGQDYPRFSPEYSVFPGIPCSQKWKVDLKNRGYSIPGFPKQLASSESGFSKTGESRGFPMLDR